jgi:hypothetical protein
MASKKNRSSVKNNKNDSFTGMFYELMLYFHTNIQSMNTSKMFAGCMIILLNVASKFVTIKLSKTMESYLKHSFSRDALIFAIAWVGSRDIYTAILIVLIFVIFVDFLMNEDSAYCIFPKAFCNYHINLLNNDDVENIENMEKVVTPEEIVNATNILTKAKQQNISTNSTLNKSYQATNTFMHG